MKTSEFARLEKELDGFREIMAMASDSILDNEVSRYPIFVAHQHQLEIGVPLTIEREAKWEIHASSLEEFVAKQIIESHKLDSFRTIYKDPRKFHCIFVVNELGANFVMIPRERKQDHIKNRKH